MAPRHPSLITAAVPYAQTSVPTSAAPSAIGLRPLRRMRIPAVRHWNHRHASGVDSLGRPLCRHHTLILEPGPLNTLALGPSWLDPDYLLNTFGLPGLLLIVFAESGLLIGFFLPGDSLLFTTGLLVTTGQLKYPLWLVCTLIAVAAIVGDQVGYLFGRKVGPALFKRPDSRLFKQENVEKAHEFFEKHGPKSLVLARFVPIVRTFTPIIAGVSRMNYRSFITYNVVGAILWGVGVTVLGALLGKIDFVHEHIEMILILIVLISVVPIVIEVLRARSQGKKAAALEGDGTGRPPAGGNGPSSGQRGRHAKR